MTFTCERCNEEAASEDCCCLTEAWEMTGELLCDDCAEELFSADAEAA